MSSGSIEFEKNGYVSVITINRPEKHNAITGKMIDELHVIVNRINSDDDIRVAVITGKGEKSFCAGTDLKEMEKYKSTWEIRNRKDYCDEIKSIRKPTVAAVNGYALGGGFEMALCCDIRVASENAQFGATETKLGWHGGNITLLLPRLIGYGKALMLLLTGVIINANEAQKTGIIEKLVPHEKLLIQSIEIANQIAKNAPIALQTTKHLVHSAANIPFEIGTAWQADLQAYCFSTEDAAEGITSFKEKRNPKFKAK